MKEHLATPYNVLTLTRLNLRRWRTDGAAPWVTLGVVLVAAFLIAALPRFVNGASDRAIAAALEKSTARNRNIGIEQAMRIPPGPADTVFAGVSNRGADLRGGLAPSIEGIIDVQRHVVDSPMFQISPMPGEDDDGPLLRFLRFRHQDGIEDRIRLVEGTLPAPADPVTVSLDGENAPTTVPVHQAAITAATSETIGLQVGSRALLAPQRDDPLTAGVPSRELEYRLVVEISGIIEITEPDAEYWYSDERLHRPFTVSDPTSLDPVAPVFAMALMAGDDYPRLLERTRPSLWSYGWRFFVDAARLDSSRIEAVERDLRDLELRLGSSAFARIDEPRLRTGLDGIFDRYRSQRRLAVSALSIAVAALIVLAVAVVALLGVLTANRRRDAILLARSRGASSRQLAAARILEGFVLFLPAAVAGVLASILISDARGPAHTWAVGAGVAAAIALIVTVLAAPTYRGDLRRLLSGEGAAQRGEVRRLVVEAAVAIAAVVGLVLLRRRGLGVDERGPEGSFDPFLAAVPVLAGIAAALFMLRLYPLPLRWVGWLASRRRAAVGFVGFRRLVDQPPTARLPLPTMLVAVGIAVFAVVLVDSIAAGREDAAWQEVGADFRLESFTANEPLSELADVSIVPSVEATADATLLDARLDRADGRLVTIPVLALEVAEYQTVVVGTGADPELPRPVLAELASDGVRTPENAVPSIVSVAWPTAPSPRQGEVFTLVVGRDPVVARVSDVRSSFPGLEPGQPFVVLARSSLDAVTPSTELPVTRRYIRAPDTAAAELQTAVRSQSLGSRLVSRRDLVADRVEAPLVAAVDNGYRGTVALAAVLAVLSALAAIALTAADRSRDFGYLRTLGLSPAQVQILTTIEQLTPAAAATGAGVAFGLALAWLVRPALDLAPFTGAAIPVQVVVAWPQVLLAAAAVLATVTVATAIYSARTRRASLGDVLRRGDR